MSPGDDMTSETMRPEIAAPPASEDRLELPASLTGPDLIKAGKDYLARGRERMIELNLKVSARAACAFWADWHDQLLAAVYRRALARWAESGKGDPGSIAMVGLGGYGRRELSLKSDVDLLFLMGPKKTGQEEFTKEILHFLFDLNLELGYVVRRTEDCINVIGTDLQSTTALMESRLIEGSQPLFQHFHEGFYRHLRATSARRWFAQTQLQEWRNRREKFDASVYLLEPNIKESIGGLRDIHTVGWVLAIRGGSTDLTELERRGVLTPEELERLRSAEEFILKLRNELHALSPRKSDVLNFPMQFEIARRLNYSGDENIVAAEALMRDYYRNAREAAKLSQRAFLILLRAEQTIVGNLMGTLKRKKITIQFSSQDGAIFPEPKSENYIFEDPVRIMELFALAAKLRLRVSERTRERIEKFVPTLGDDFRENPTCRIYFMQVLDGVSFVAQTLEDMHDCGLLSAYIPEFERIRCMVRIDHYHRYTVDEHLLKAVGKFERLLAEPAETRSHASRIANETPRPDLMNLSLLLHDVGKGYGKGHALRGGQLVQRIGHRMGLDHEDVETLRFLTLSHLKFSHVSQRRDLDDPRVGREMAEEVGNLDLLKMLYVHSVCDAQAVSPEAWTDWKANLYEALYRVTAAALDGKIEQPFEVGHPIAEVASRIWDHLCRRPPANMPESGEEQARLCRKLEDFVENVPDRYLQVMRVETIAKHFMMLQRINDQERIVWELEPGLGASDLAVCSADEPGIFASICGALAAKDINILSAQIFSTADGYAINLFQVTDLHQQPLPVDIRLDRLRADLNEVMLGRKTMDELFRKHRSRSGLKWAERVKRPTEITLNNDASQQYTLVEIRASDRPGLLYRISKVFSEQKLNVHRAMISTEAYGVFDVFYVTDFEYNKLHDVSRLNRLKAELIRGIDHDDPDVEPEAARS